MSYLDNLYSEKNRYEGLKSNVNNAIEKLSVIASDLDMPISKLNDSFQIDGFSLGANVLNSIKGNLESKNNNLINKVIPNINGEISSYNSRIYEEEDRIRKEREEAERQERIRKEIEEAERQEKERQLGILKIKE